MYMKYLSDYHEHPLTSLLGLLSRNDYCSYSLPVAVDDVDE